MSLEALQSEWNRLTIADPKSLRSTIDQIHRGAQFISMVGKFYVKNEPDDSHTNLEWLNDQEVLAGNWAPSPMGNFRFAMRSKDLTLVMYNEDMTEVDHCSLHGLSNDTILDWVKIHLHQFEVDSELMKLDIHYDIPHHPTDDGVPYDFSNPELFEEMAKHRANSDFILKGFASQYPNASSVRTWPHHFDHGAYIPMVFDEKDNATKSFSIGMAIHDEAMDELYYYITTWSAAGDNSYTDLPKLPCGEWITTPFNGAILRSSEIAALPSIEAQAGAICRFLVAGINASKKVLGV